MVAGYLELVKLRSLRAQSFIWPPSLLTPTANLRGSPNHHHFIIHFGESQNSLKAIILILVTYYRERIEIKTSQGKKFIGWSPGKLQTQFPGLSFHAIRTYHSPIFNVWKCTWIIVNKESSPKAWCPEFLLELHYVDLID